MSQKLPKLKPLVHSWVKNITSNPKNLGNWIEQYQSPINIHHLIPFIENQQKFTRLFDKYGVKHQIFFARKANKVKAYVQAANHNHFGVDTASLNELKECIETGLEPEKITITAAVKNRDLLTYAVSHQVPVILDNLDECNMLQEILSQSNQKLKVGFRVSGFEFEGSKLYSRFGFDIEIAEKFITENVGDGKMYDCFEYHGLHFHLNGYSIEERAEALFQILNLAESLGTVGYTTKFIDIGGGILMNYLESEQEWLDFHKALKNSLNEDAEEITFRKDPLGMIVHEGKVIGEPKVYPYFNSIPQEKFLEKMLLKENNDKKLYEELVRLAIELRIEPGRSLLDQCGITVARVGFRKKDMEGRLLIGLEMNRTQMFSSSADFLLDPIFIPKNKTKTSPCAGYFVGAYCLEQELLLKRKVQFSQYPEIGDLVCFVNTAGYMMHFYESEAHLFNLAENLVASNEWGWEVKLDKDFILK